MARKRNLLPPSGFTVLVVDDQEETLESVSALLVREGHRILTADSGHKALEMFRENAVHLLLVDYFMPRMTGEELVREIRTLDPHVQIVLQTGYSGEKPPRQMLRELDIQGYHSKSDGPERLLLWVDVALKAHRQMSMVLDAERLKSAMLTNLSHEFRTPLTTVIGYSELMREGLEEMSASDLREALTHVTSASERLLRMVDAFLNMVGLEAGRLELNTERTHVSRLAAEIVENLRPMAEAKGLSFHATGDMDVQIMTDEQKLRSIISSLLSNAIKFTEKGEVEVAVTRGGKMVAIAVSDTGIGIDRAHHQTIFERFRQVDGSLSRRQEGMGLGLALVKELTTILGGSIEVESATGVGSRFTVHLPSLPRQQLSRSSPSQEVPDELSAGGPP